MHNPLAQYPANLRPLKPHHLDGRRGSTRPQRLVSARIIVAEGNQVSDAQLAHVAKRHRRPGWVPWGSSEIALQLRSKALVADWSELLYPVE